MKEFFVGFLIFSSKKTFFMKIVYFNHHKKMKVVLEFPEKPELKNLDIAQYLATKMYQDGLLSAGQAALLIGKNKEEFLGQLSTYGVSVFSESVEDFLKDIKSA